MGRFAVNSDFDSAQSEIEREELGREEEEEEGGGGGSSQKSRTKMVKAIRTGHKTGAHTLLPCRSESDRMPGPSLAAAEEVVHSQL